jgi:hypothetical protein
MESFNYGEQFELALQCAFSARNPTVRSAYFDLADFYRDKIDEEVLRKKATEVLESLKSRNRQTI